MSCDGGDSSRNVDESEQILKTCVGHEEQEVVNHVDVETTESRPRASLGSQVLDGSSDLGSDWIRPDKENL